MTETQRVQQVLSGNTSAFAYFVETYQHMAITIAYRVCDNMQNAEDVVQESFVKAYRNLHTYKGRGKFSSWFYRIVYNTAVSYCNVWMWRYDSNVSVEEVTLHSEFNIEDEMAKSEMIEMTSNILSEMPKDYALLLTLYYLEDNLVRDVAKIVGLSESNVKVILYRARQLFKQLWISQYKTIQF